MNQEAKEDKIISPLAYGKTCVVFSIAFTYIGAIYGTSLALTYTKSKLETIGRIILYFLIGGCTGGVCGLFAPIIVPILGLYYIIKNEILKY